VLVLSIGCQALISVEWVEKTLAEKEYILTLSEEQALYLCVKVKYIVARICVIPKLSLE
jgi:hypothetical protein